MSMSNLLKVYSWCWRHLIVDTSILFRRILLAFFFRFMTLLHISGVKLLLLLLLLLLLSLLLCFNLASQRAKRHANFDNGNFYTLLSCKKFCIYTWYKLILDILTIRIICICIVHENCIILHFYTSHHIMEIVLYLHGHIKEKSMGFVF